MSQPVFSIITVTYNAAGVLQRTMDSVAGQDYPWVEYLVVDGASKDNTMSLVQAQSAHMPIRYISERDNGLYDAMNKGLAMATGDYVLFLNAGDELAEAHTLSRLVQQSPSADVYYGHALIVNLDGDPLGLRKPFPPRKLSWKSLQRGMSVCHQAFIVKRSLAPMYDLQYRICADIDWMIRCLKNTKEHVYSEEVISRFLADGLSTTHRKKAWKERYLVLQKHYGWLVNFLNHLYIILRYPFRKGNL